MIKKSALPHSLQIAGVVVINLMLTLIGDCMRDAAKFRADVCLEMTIGPLLLSHNKTNILVLLHTRRSSRAIFIESLIPCRNAAHPRDKVNIQLQSREQTADITQGLDGKQL